MITKIKVLIPYSSRTSLNSGQTFTPGKKPVLITGPSGSGKSSLLHMIYESSRINRLRNHPVENNTGNIQANYHQFESTLNTMLEFADGDADFDEYVTVKLDDRLPEGTYEVLEEELGHDNTESEDYINKETEMKKKILKDGLEHMLDVLRLEIPEKELKEGAKENIFTHEIPLDPSYLMRLAYANPDLFKLPSMTEDTFIYSLTQYTWVIEKERGEEIHIHKVVEEYVDALTSFASEKGFSARQLFSIAANMDMGTLGAYINPFNTWLFTQLSGGKEGIAAHYNVPGEKDVKRAALLNKKGEEEYLKTITGSSGEINKNYMDQILNLNGNRVILLDEPMANLDEGNQDKYTNKIIDKAKDNQIFVVSHDRFLNKVLKDDGWYHIDLGKK